MNIKALVVLAAGALLTVCFTVEVEAASPILTVLAPKKKKKKCDAPSPAPKASTEQKGENGATAAKRF